MQGGGIFLPEAFYEAADRNGVLLFHDMMFTTTSKTHEPSGSAEEAAELQNGAECIALFGAMFSICNMIILPRQARDKYRKS